MNLSAGMSSTSNTRKLKEVKKLKFYYFKMNLKIIETAKRCLLFNF